MATAETTTHPRLTKSTVERLPTPATGHVIAWDRDLKGFGVRISPTGRRSYFVHKRLPSGKQVLTTLGQHGALTAEQARTRAKALLGQIAAGIDPTAERRQAKQAEQARKTLPTVNDLAERYQEEHLPTKRTRSAVEDRAMIRDYILPVLGRIKVADVTRDDIRRLHRQVTQDGKPYRANRVLACASKMFALAVGDWCWRADNPCKGVRKNSEDGRERYLEDAELARLAEVLARHPEPTTVALIRFLLLTGCRLSEATQATWSQFDLSAASWCKPSSHTKTKKQHTVPLSPPVLEILAGLKREDGNPLAFPSPKTGRPLVTIKTAWRTIRREAGLEDVRLHDLRHSFASLLASSGASLPLIGSLLGHTQSATTQRYSHLTDRARREAVERVGALVAGNGQTAAEIVPLRRA